METICKFILCVFIAGALVLTPHITRPEEAGNIDVLLVIDSSGSMQKTDPLSLRVPAAKLFISLLDEGDRAGIVSFSDKGYALSDLVFVDSKENKEKLFSAADRISADGLYTNLFEGFNSGYAALSLNKEPDREKIMILMSDGMMDVGDLDQDMRLIDTLQNSLTETLREDNIRVYTIAFTDNSDKKLLEKIAKRTGGFYNTALTDKDFHGVFTSIFESLKSPEMVPMRDNSFVIDSAIEELTIVATKGDPDTEIQIIAPSGKSYSSSQKYSGVGWFVSENFDMITILKPLEGKWEILFSTGENNKAYVITDLKLRTDFNQMYAIFGQQMDIRIWLEKDGAKITEEQVLDKIDVHIEMTGPDGNTTKLQAFQKGEGIFLRTFAPFTPGTHKMKLIAEGMTFSRAKSFAFNVANLEESKKDLEEQREEKKKLMAAQSGSSNEGEKNEEVSFMKLFAQFIVMNIVLGLIALCFFRREKVLDFVKNGNVQDLMHRVKSLAAFMKKRRKAGEEQGEAEVSNAMPESPSSPQGGEGAEEKTAGSPAEEAAPAAAPDRVEQPEEEDADQEIREVQEIKSEPEAETAREAPPEQDAEAIQEAGAGSDGEGPEETLSEESQKKTIDLEEIEMEEKGKHEEILKEDRQQAIESPPGGDAENDLLETAAQAVDMLNAGTENNTEAAPDELDDIELTQKDGSDGPSGTPQESVSDEETAQPDEADDDVEDIELTPKVSPDRSDEDTKEAASEDISEQHAEISVDGSPDIQPAAEQSADQPDEMPEETEAVEDTELSAKPSTDESADIQAEADRSADQAEESSDNVAPDEDAKQAGEPAADTDIFDSVMAEMEEAMDQNQPGRNADTTPDGTQPSDNTPGTEEDIPGA